MQAVGGCILQPMPMRSRTNRSTQALPAQANAGEASDVGHLQDSAAAGLKALARLLARQAAAEWQVGSATAPKDFIVADEASEDA